MKRTNPILLRLGYSKNWDNHLNVVNIKQTLPVVLQSFVFLKNWLKKISFSQNSSVFVSSIIKVYVNKNVLLLYLKYFFISRSFLLKFTKNGIPFFKKKKFTKIYNKKKKDLYFNSFFVLKRMFSKLENFFWQRFLIHLKIKAFNMYKLFCSDQILLFLKIVSRNITWKHSNIYSLVLLILYAFYFKDVFLLGFIISKELRLNKKHYKVLNMLTFLFSSVFTLTKKTQGLLLRISGRWNSNNRTKTKVLVFGTPSSLQKIDTSINYTFCKSITSAGVFGIKIWLF